MNIYERIRILREAQGMSQYELALKVGYKGRSAISKVENGERDISQSMIAKYAEALGVTPTYLLFGVNDEVNVQTESSPSPNDASLPEDVIIYHRNGKTVTKQFTKEQMDMLLTMIEAIPEKNKDI